jgi:hypothetical protein
LLTLSQPGQIYVKEIIFCGTKGHDHNMHKLTYLVLKHPDIYVSCVILLKGSVWIFIYLFFICIIHPCGSSKYKYKQTKHRKHRKLQSYDIIGYTKYILLTIIIFFTCHTFDRQGPHFCNSVDCFIKSPTSAKSSELAFNKIFFFLMVFLQ